MNISDAKKIIKAASLADDTVIMEAIHGVGKSSIVDEYAKEENLLFVPLFLSHMEMGDILGMPRTIAVEGEVVTSWTAPDWINRIISAAFPPHPKVEDLVFGDKDFEAHTMERIADDIKDGRVGRGLLNQTYCEYYGLLNDELHIISNQTNLTYKHAKPAVLFLDELNRSPLDVRQGTMQLVLERELHSHKLPYVNGVQTQIVAAINPADQYQVDELDPALLDRFLHITVESDTPAWLDWARNNKVNDVVTSFIAENPTKLHFQPEDGSIGATPRSWAKLANFVDVMDKIPGEIRHAVMKGKIGSALASQFLTYYNNFSKTLKMADIEKEIKKATKKYPEDIEKVGEAVKKLIANQEVIQKSEMAKNFFAKYIKHDKAADAYPLLAYLYGLELELRAAFLKNTRQESVENYTKLAKFDKELNNKKLFLSITQSIK